MIGIGLMAMPTAKGRISPITSLMRYPRSRITAFLDTVLSHQEDPTSWPILTAATGAGRNCRGTATPIAPLCLDEAPC
jgi:hypothetical protein